MDGRQGQGHVSHIGRAATALLCLADIWKDTTKRLGIAAVEGSHGRIVMHLGIGRTAAKDLQVRASGEGPGFKAAQDFGTDRIKVVERLGAYDVPCRRLSGDNSGRLAALGDNAV